MTFVNQYSFPLTAIAILAGLAFFLMRDGVQKRDLVAIAALTLGFLIAFILLQPGSGNINQVDEVKASLGQGTPVLLEFQSQY